MSLHSCDRNFSKFYRAYFVMETDLLPQLEMNNG